MTRKTVTLSIAIALTIFFGAVTAKAETFTSEEFLTWKVSSQDFYIRTSITMAGLIVRQSSTRDGDCIDQWYFSDIDSRNKFLKNVMRKNSEYHPHGIILGILQKQCGKFKYGAGS